MVYLISFLAVVLTLAGGLFALKFRDKLHLILGFAAGAVVGVAFFDLMPEAIEMLEPALGLGSVMFLIAFGFVAFMMIERITGWHAHVDSVVCVENHGHEFSCRSGVLGVSSLAVHSFIDGLAVGWAFQAGNSVGIAVAVAVLAHNFSDGINTVGLILRGGKDVKLAFKWLIADALAPALGIFVASFAALSENILGIILALFAGSFFYMGAGDLLPESHHRHPAVWTTFSSVLGIGLIYAIVRVSGV